MTTSAEDTPQPKGRAITAQVYALFLREGLIPAMAVGEVHDLAVSIEDWKVEEARGDRSEHLTTDRESWVTARGIVRHEVHGAEDGHARLVVDGEGFLLLGIAEVPRRNGTVDVTGLVYIEPTRMPVFGLPNPMALPMRRPWRVLELRREILGGRRGRPTSIDRLPEPAEVDTGSYYFADVLPA